MKTTIEISDSLLEAAREVAGREKSTVRALVEEGLRKVIAERRQNQGFKLRRATFQGKGLHPQVIGSSWEQVREIIYEEHGA